MQIRVFGRLVWLSAGVQKIITLPPRQRDELDDLIEYQAKHPPEPLPTFSTGATWVPWCGKALSAEYEGQDPAERRANETARDAMRMVHE